MSDPPGPEDRIPAAPRQWELCPDRALIAPDRRDECPVALSAGRSETPIARKDDGLGPRPHPELVEDVGNVVANGLPAQAEPLGHLRVAQSLGEQGEDGPLARGQRREG